MAPETTTNSPDAASQAEARIAHMEDVARFSLDSAAMFGTDIEVLDALKTFHDTNAKVSSHRALQHEVGSPKRVAVEASATSDREHARALTAEGEQLTDEQKERVANARQSTKDEVIAVAVEGDTSFYTDKYGAERGKKHIDFYKELAVESVKRAHASK